MIDWASFTPASAVTGGILIGAACGMLILVNGRIAGISGILGGLLHSEPGERPWRVAFLVGMIGAPLVYSAFRTLPTMQIDAGFPMLIAAGLLVGVGTRYAGGCTSGHGVCGLSRLSVRSLLATITFMAAGFATVFVLRHAVGG